MDDLQIIELFFSREESAIRETDLKYGKLCRHIAQNILGNLEDTEECVQDTYLALWNQIPPLRPVNFSAFLCRIARNLSLKKLEYNRAEKRDTNADIPLTELEGILAADRAVESDDLTALINTFLRSEKELPRKIFLRRYWFFDSVGDIARQFSCSESKVKSILFRTRNRLREYLKKEGIDV